MSLRATAWAWTVPANPTAKFVCERVPGPCFQTNWQLRRMRAADVEKEAAARRRARARAAQARGKHTKLEWDAMRRYCRGCVQCGCTTHERALTRDHIVPLAHGGSDSIENIQPLCWLCNSTKGARYIGDLRPAGWREDVAEFIAGFQQ